MSGSLGYLTSLFNTSSGTSDPLLNVLYDLGGSSSTQDPVQALQTAERTQTQGLKVTAVQPVAQHAVTAFTNAARSVNDLPSNPAVMNVRLTAGGRSDQILGDLTLRTLVTTALGIPQQIAFQDLTAQQNAISSQLDVRQFQDPKFFESLAQRHLIANNANASSSTSLPSLTALALQGQGVVA